MNVLEQARDRRRRARRCRTIERACGSWREEGRAEGPSQTESPARATCGPQLIEPGLPAISAMLRGGATIRNRCQLVIDRAARRPALSKCQTGSRATRANASGGDEASELGRQRRSRSGCSARWPGRVGPGRAARRAVSSIAPMRARAPPSDCALTSTATAPGLQGTVAQGEVASDRRHRRRPRPSDRRRRSPRDGRRAQGLESGVHAAADREARAPSVRTRWSTARRPRSARYMGNGAARPPGRPARECGPRRARSSRGWPAPIRR